MTRTTFSYSVFSLAVFMLMLGGYRVVAATTVAKPTPVASPEFTLSALPDAVVYNDFVVGPGKIEVTLNPGESRTIDLTIANRLGTEKSFSVSEEDFVGSNDPKQPVVLLGDDRGPYSLKDFIALPHQAIDIPHAEKAFVPVTISVPANAQPGGMYGSVIVSVTTRPGSVVSPEGATTASNPIITRLATLFFVRIAGAAHEEGRLADFSLAGHRALFLDTMPMTFDLTFENTGNVHLVPQGTVTITNMFGSSMGNIDVDPWFAMPQSLRFREVLWNPPFLFGRYTAHASIKRGYGSTTDELSLVFWVIPWKIILALLVGLTLVIFIIRWIVMHVKIVPSRS